MTKENIELTKVGKEQAPEKPKVRKPRIDKRPQGEQPEGGNVDLLDTLTQAIERDLKGEAATEEDAFERQQKAYELFKLAYKAPEILDIYGSTIPEDLSDLDSGVRLGIIPQETVTKYRRAIEILKQTEEQNPTHPNLGALRNAIDQTYEEFRKAALIYIEEKQAERKSRLKEYFERHQPKIQEHSDRIQELDRDPNVVEKLKSFFRSRDMLIEEEHERKKIEKAEAEKRQEEAKAEAEMKERDEILRDWQSCIDSVGASHQKVFENLQKVLPDASFVKLQTIIDGFVSNLNIPDREEIYAIQKMIVRHIMDSPEDSLTLKTPHDLIPWFQRPTATYRYNDTFDVATNKSIVQLRSEAKERGTKITTLTTEEKMVERMDRLEKENAILRILIGSREKSPIWGAFEDRRDLKEEGKLESYLAERQKAIEEAQKREEEKSKRLKEKEKSQMEFKEQLGILEEDPCSASFVVPIYESRVAQGVREMRLVRQEEVLIKFEPFRAKGGTIMIKVEYMVDKNADSFETSIIGEISGTRKGRVFDLNTLSGAPQWIKNGMSDATKAKIKTFLEDSEKKEK